MQRWAGAPLRILNIPARGASEHHRRSRDAGESTKIQRRAHPWLYVMVLKRARGPYRFNIL